MQSNNININGINRDKLLELLWANAINNFNRYNIQYNESLAKKQLDKNGYADYICGRPIKSQIYYSDEINSFYYNRDNGENKMEEIIEYMKSDNYNSKLIKVIPENLTLENNSINNDLIDPNVMAEALALHKDLF